jgi:uncharacterized protein YkwD
LNELFELTDAIRADRGLPPLKLNTELSKAAQKYAERMSREGWFDHVDSDGASPGERLGAAGYAWFTCGENIARGYGTAREVMRAWLESPSHRCNLLNPAFTEVGFGYVNDESSPDGWRGYWAQELAAPAR